MFSLCCTQSDLQLLTRQPICPIIYHFDGLNPTQHALQDICYLDYTVFSLIFETHFLSFIVSGDLIWTMTLTILY